MTRTATGMRTTTINAPCANCKVVFPRLFMCSACGSVAYCGRDCQKSAWRQHAPICRVLVASTDAASADGHTTILFHHAFGGLLSLAQRRMYLAHGNGVMVATLSAPPADYRPQVHVNPSRPRTVSLRYVPRNSIRSLDETLARESGTENCNLVEHACRMTSEMFPHVPGRYPGQMYVLIMRTAPNVESRKETMATMMMNWLSDTHPAHRAFSTDIPLTDEQLVGAVYNWDTKETQLPPASPVRTLPAEIVETIISKEFYNECMRKHRQRKARLKRGKPITERGMYPPFAQSFSINRVPES